MFQHEAYIIALQLFIVELEIVFASVGFRYEKEVLAFTLNYKCYLFNPKVINFKLINTAHEQLSLNFIFTILVIYTMDSFIRNAVIRSF